MLRAFVYRNNSFRSCAAAAKCSRKRAFLARVGRANLREGLTTVLMQQKKSRSTYQLFFRGAEKRIRTSGRVTPVTRFPIVLLKPLRHLCKSFLKDVFPTTLRLKKRIQPTPLKGSPRLSFGAKRSSREPPDESPPSHDFQSCSLNHSNISAKAMLSYHIPAKKATVFARLSAKKSREIFPSLLNVTSISPCIPLFFAAALKTGKILQ